MNAEPYTGPVTLFTTYAEPELRGQDGELIATFLPHRLAEARRIAALWNAAVPAAPPRPRRPAATPPEHCDGQQSKCRWVPDGAGSKCLTCGDAIPF